MKDDEKKQRILNITSDMVARLLYYDRKEDEELPCGEIEKCIDQGIITTDDIINCFKKELEKGL